jgi:hypothetical protein
MAMLTMLGVACLVLGGVCVALIRRSIRQTPTLQPEGFERSSHPSGATLDSGRLAESLDRMAMQAQLLALTATVEVARAGEGGSGMARVADDARSLAQCAAGMAGDLQGRPGAKPEPTSARPAMQGAGAAQGQAAGAALPVREMSSMATPGDPGA